MKFTRREWLEGVTGLAMACSTRRRRTIGGSIVGGAHARGHLVREAMTTRPDGWGEVTVAILGGGIAGLSAAWALERAGLHDFVVLELEDSPGGTARSGTGTVTPYPWGAHYVPVPSPENRSLLALLEEVGAVSGRDAAGTPMYAEDVLCRDPQERVFFRGEWFEGLYPRIGATSADLGQLETFEAEMKRWSLWRDAAGRRAFDIPRARGSDHADVRALDGLSMADYLDREGWSSPRLRWLVEYACRDDFGATLAQTSAWAGVHYFAARLDPESGEGAPFLTWPEGNGRLVRHLASVAGPRLRLAMVVREVHPGPDQVQVVAFDAREGRPVGWRARHVVFALPRFLAARVIVTGRTSPPPQVDSEYGAWMVANLTLRDRPQGRGFPLAWDNVLYASPSLGYVVATHQTGRDHGPTVFTYYLPLVDDDPRKARQRLLHTPWEQWVSQIVADLKQAHPDLEDVLETVDVYLWGHAMVRPRPGAMWSAALRESARPLGRLHFAHTDLSGMALFEEAQYWGLRAARAVLATERRAVPAWLA